MKTRTNKEPTNRQLTSDGSHHPSPTNRLSDRAFYLIALANLLRKTVEPGQLQQFLVPGTKNGSKGSTMPASG